MWIIATGRCVHNSRIRVNVNSVKSSLMWRAVFCYMPYAGQVHFCGVFASHYLLVFLFLFFFLMI